MAGNDFSVPMKLIVVATSMMRRVSSVHRPPTTLLHNALTRSVVLLTFTLSAPDPAPPVTWRP
jgi:hypothetical protein